MIAQDPSFSGARSLTGPHAGGRTETRAPAREGREGAADFDTVLQERPARGRKAGVEDEPAPAGAEAAVPADAAAAAAAVIVPAPVLSAAVAGLPAGGDIALAQAGAEVAIIVPEAVDSEAAPVEDAAGTVGADFAVALDSEEAAKATAAEAGTPETALVALAADQGFERKPGRASRTETGAVPTVPVMDAKADRPASGPGEAAAVTPPPAAGAEPDEGVAVEDEPKAEPAPDAGRQHSRAHATEAGPLPKTAADAQPAIPVATAAATPAAAMPAGVDGLSLAPAALDGMTLRTDAGAASPAATAQAAAVVGQVAVALGKAHEPKIEIRLDPPELGRVHIHLTPTDTGGVQAVVAADRPETQDLLRRHADLLARELADAGYQGVNLQFAAGGDAGARQQSAEAPAGTEVASILAPLAVAAATAMVQPARLVTGGLDIRL